MGSECRILAPFLFLNPMNVLRINTLSKTYFSGFRKKIQALKTINLTVEKDEIFGFLGPNGAGKTTTLKIITGLLKPTSGAVTIFDKPLSNVSIREKIGFLPEHPSYYNHLTGFELLDFAGGLFGISTKEKKKRIEHLLNIVGLVNAQITRVSDYSKGMVQRLAIAQALINNPELVILDEPLSGLDPIGRKEIKDIILSLKEDGKTVFFSTHILADVERLCDKVGILHKGKLLKIGTLSELLIDRKRKVNITFEFSGNRKLPILTEAKHTAEGYWNIIVERDKQEETMRALLREGANIISIIPETMTLEDFFVAEIARDEA